MDTISASLPSTIVYNDKIAYSYFYAKRIRDELVNYLIFSLIIDTIIHSALLSA